MIIEKITKQSYEEYFQKEILSKVALSSTGFDKDPYLLNLLSKDYGVNNQEQIPLLTDSALVKEVGTGNMMMSARDLYVFYKGLIEGDIITPESLKKMWTLAPEHYHYSYKAGAYHQEANNIYAHGVLRSYESTMYLSNDGQTGVILLSNCYQKEVHVALGKKLYQLLLG